MPEELRPRLRAPADALWRQRWNMPASCAAFSGCWLASRRRPDGSSQGDSCAPWMPSSKSGSSASFSCLLPGQAQPAHAGVDVQRGGQVTGSLGRSKPPMPGLPPAPGCSGPGIRLCYGRRKSSSPPAIRAVQHVDALGGRPAQDLGQQRQTPLPRVRRRRNAGRPALPSAGRTSAAPSHRRRP